LTKKVENGYIPRPKVRGRSKMSRSCELTGVKAQMGRRVPINRSQTGVRTKRSFVPNIQDVSVLSDALGKVSLKLAVKTIRSIEHNGGLDQFLINKTPSKLTAQGRRLRKEILAKTTLAPYVAKAPRAVKPSKKATKAAKAKKAA
jgi:large subunit ribosomal protein L28